ncbi:MAG TPA: hypothetical protein VFO39_21890, partial [Candidatus Sulfotelmatobacter sp.]|nr:hypothetical protein [Candidatus Sulfotelmatobacter sp.]
DSILRQGTRDRGNAKSLCRRQIRHAWAISGRFHFRPVMFVINGSCCDPFRGERMGFVLEFEPGLGRWHAAFHFQLDINW